MSDEEGNGGNDNKQMNTDLKINQIDNYHSFVDNNFNNQN